MVKDDCGTKIVRLLSNSKKPLEAAFLIEKLKVNKTTVYRQIEKLLMAKILTEVEFGDGKKRYELKSLGHHHHVVCKKCGKMEDICFDEELIMNTLIKKTNFVIESHSLEFFGYCVNCK